MAHGALDSSQLWGYTVGERHEMSLYYFDASALVKYYVIEPGSMWVREISDQI